MARLTQQMRDAYEEFLVEIPMLLEDLQELLSKSPHYQGQKVDFEGDSLDRIEQFYLDAIEGKENVGVSRARLNRIIIAYFGQALIERAGGNWALNEARRDPSFGTPVVVRWGTGDSMAFSPVERRELLIQNRKPFLREFIAYAVNKEQFEKDFFKEFE